MISSRTGALRVLFAVMTLVLVRAADAHAQGVPVYDKTMGHQTLTLAAVWKPYLGELLQSLPPEKLANASSTGQ